MDWRTPLRVARVAGAAGFIFARWLLALCNVPALCGWFAAASSLLAVLYVFAFLTEPRVRRYAVLGRPGARLLAVTCVLSLAGRFLIQTEPEPESWRATFASGLDLVAWAWALAGALAAARWLWPEAPSAAGVADREPIAPRHLLLSSAIMLVLALQVAVLFKARPTLWPFIDYPLYGGAHIGPVRAVHHRMYGLTAEEPVEFFEMTADALGMSWFVYHTQLIPRMFEQPQLVLDDFRRTIESSDLPPLRLLLPERTTFALDDSEIVEFPERRPVPLEPATGGSGSGANGRTRVR